MVCCAVSGVIIEYLTASLDVCSPIIVLRGLMQSRNLPMNEVSWVVVCGLDPALWR